MTDPLVIRLSGVEIGELLPDATLRWHEDADRIAPLNARVLSHSLPFGATGMDPAPFFGGLLPRCGIHPRKRCRRRRIGGDRCTAEDRAHLGP
jgi:hypothetical protein